MSREKGLHNTDRWREVTKCDHFPSPGAFVDWLEEQNRQHPNRMRVDRNVFDTTIAIAKAGGNREIGERVGKLITECNVDDCVTAGPAYWEPSRVGIMPVVPNVVAGIPETMLTLAEAKGPRGPVTVVMDRGLSGGTDYDSVIRYGAAVISLVLTLQRVRPVEVIITSTNMGARITYVPMVHLGTAPFDPAQLAFWLADSNVERALAFQHKYFQDPSADLTWGWRMYDRMEEMERRVANLATDGSGDVLMVGPARLADVNEIERDPKAWVRKMLRRYAPQMFADGDVQ